MVKFISKTIELIKSAINYRRCKAAIKKADRLKVTTGRKQLVLMSRGKPVVVSKQSLKRSIMQHGFRKGFTIQDAERIAIYQTL